MISDVGTMLTACLAGAGIAQVMALGTEELMRTGQLIDLFPDWSGERFPLFLMYPSRLHQPAKVHAFIEFCVDAISI